MTILLAQQSETVAPEGLANWIDTLIEPFANMGEAFVAFLPYLLVGLIVLGVGLLIAKIVRAILRKTTEKLQLDAAAKKLGLGDLLGKFGIQKPFSEILSSAIYWVLILVFLKVASDIMGVKDISAFINSLILFLPKLLISGFILLGGLLAADFVRGMTHSALDRFGFDYSGLVAGFLYGLLAVMIFTVVLSQLGIETELINASVKIFLGALALAIAIALGFGLRPVARNVVSGVYARDLFPPGSIVEIEDKEATIVEVGAVATRLERGENRFFVIPNSQLISQVTSGRHGIRNFSEKM